MTGEAGGCVYFHLNREASKRAKKLEARLLATVIRQNELSERSIDTQHSGDSSSSVLKTDHIKFWPHLVLWEMRSRATHCPRLGNPS